MSQMIWDILPAKPLIQLAKDGLGVPQQLCGNALGYLIVSTHNTELIFGLGARLT